MDSIIFTTEKTATIDRLYSYQTVRCQEVPFVGDSATVAGNSACGCGLRARGVHGILAGSANIVFPKPGSKWVDPRSCERSGLPAAHADFAKPRTRCGRGVAETELLPGPSQPVDDARTAQSRPDAPGSHSLFGGRTWHAAVHSPSNNVAILPPGTDVALFQRFVRTTSRSRLPGRPTSDYSGPLRRLNLRCWRRPRSHLRRSSSFLASFPGTSVRNLGMGFRHRWIKPSAFTAVFGLQTSVRAGVTVRQVSWARNLTSAPAAVFVIANHRETVRSTLKCSRPVLVHSVSGVVIEVVMVNNLQYFHGPVFRRAFTATTAAIGNDPEYIE